MVSEIYLLNISPLRLNAILISAKAVPEWQFDIMGYGDWVIRQPSGDPRGGDVRGYDFRNSWAFRMGDTMIEYAGGNAYDHRDA